MVRPKRPSAWRVKAARVGCGGNGGYMGGANDKPVADVDEAGQVSLPAGPFTIRK